MSRMKVAVIGLGKVARVHLEAYRAVAGIDVVAGADPAPAQRKWADTEFALVTYADYREMIVRQRPHLVCVLAPASLHREAAVFAMEQGCHVLCEKPLALNLADALAMRQAAARHKVKFFYGASYRYLPALTEARALIRQGAIGRVLLMTEEMIGGQGAQARRELGPIHYPAGGPGGSGSGLVDHGIHLVDVFSWLVGERVASAYGQGNISGAPAIPEYAVLHFPGGATGRLTYLDATFPTALPGEGAFSRGGAWGVGKFIPPGAWLPVPGQIMVYGETGALRVQHYANYLYLFTNAGAQAIPLVARSTPDNFARQLEQAVEDIRSSAVETVGIDIGIEALRVLLAIYQSQAVGRAVAPGSL